ncbi:MAG: hypothetical protein ABL993_08510 [Vicinamibacterales bacterium]
MNSFAADAIEEAARLSTVGIVGGSGEQKWQGMGTGTLIRWNQQHVVLTAEHVIAGTSREDLRFFLPLENPPKTAERDVLQSLHGVPTKNLFPFSEIGIHVIVSDPSLDLAALVIDGGLDGRHPTARFFEMAPGGQTPAEGQVIVSRGFPHDLSRVTQQNVRVAFMYGHWADIAADGHELKNFDRALHFLAPFDDSAKDAHPAGLSGSVQWFLRPTPAPALWTANLDIAGVTITYYESERLLKMVRREVIEQFLSRYLGL